MRPSLNPYDGPCKVLEQQEQNYFLKNYNIITRNRSDEKGEDGHIAFQCPKPYARRPFSCFGCGSVEHQVKACPKRQVGDVVEEDFVEPYTNVSVICHLITGSTKVYIKSLYDSGSPISMIEIKNVSASHPLHTTELIEIEYKGLINSS